MKLEGIKLRNHPILNNLDLNFLNKKTNKPYEIIVFVGENGCGKTTLLNEIFNYSNSKYLVDKQNNNFQSLFLRQNTLYTLSQNEIVQKINVKNVPFPIGNETNLINDLNVDDLHNTSISTFNKDIISLFNDDHILEIYLNNKIKDIRCGGEALKLIDGTHSDIDLTTLSSGQQEILLKMNILQNVVASTDYILFDEPETSLHPRWQRNIIDFLKAITISQDDKSPQIFIATHSEKVLESLLKMDNIQIIRFYKNHKTFNVKPIEECELFLPKTTFAELDYVVFSIPTYDYHDQLYSFYGELCNTDSTLKIDKNILKSSFYSKKYFKKWEDLKTFVYKDGSEKTKLFEYATLPSYLRNYFHHPKKGMEPTEEELELSIEFMQKLIKERLNMLK